MYIYMSHIAVRDVLMKLSFFDNMQNSSIIVPLFIIINIAISYTMAAFFEKSMHLVKRVSIKCLSQF